MRFLERPWLLRGVVLGVALVVGLVAWIGQGDDEPVPAAPEAAPPRLVSEAELAGLAAEVGYRVYWAGPIAGTELELTEEPEGGVRLRYLEGDASPGDESTAYLTIGTYPLADPVGALEAFAAEPGSVVRRAPDGREVATATAKPTSVYFANAEDGVQVEVYDPSPRRALRLALSGQVQPAG
jgi:hypothetical protein